MSLRSDAPIAALVRTAAARRGRTRKCEIGIGTGGGGACLKPSGGGLRAPSPFSLAKET